MGKKRTGSKLICAVLTIISVAALGFMGIQKFDPQHRSLKIIEESVMTTSSSIPVVKQEKIKDKNSDALKIDAKAAVLIDGHSKKVLYAKDAKKHLPPASVTKVMTILLMIEGCESGKISLDDKVTISERAAEMGGSQMYMESGEVHTVEELLKGVIMVSANDGCVALAEHLSGSVESFVDDMNKRAKQLGLEDSNFVNTNGLPVADHYSCAYDIGMISAELMKHDIARKWFVTWQEDIKVGLKGKESKFTLTNTNKLIKTYNGSIGVKTGYTDDAGYCLSGAAERESSRFIAVVLGCESSEIRFKETQRLLDYGFANYETIILGEEGEKLKKLTIEKGNVKKAYAVLKESVKITTEKGKTASVKKVIEIDKNIKLPVSKGDPIGTMTVYAGDEKISDYELVADRDIKKAGFITNYIRMMKKMI